ncbi:MAG: oxidoreductase [Planctomycetes bacterium GWF2_41_51]|nr:MAG: oxidoreductase [Planctomycetes bacterium GWF2_41_51]HBG27067.1 oxidoreductase [Phycisphaerales bacterium]
MILAAEQNTISTKPRVGFLGMGWIGTSRMEAIIKRNLVDVITIADPNITVYEKIKNLVPKAFFVQDMEQMMEQKLDAIVIATPSALHCKQSVKALESGAAVFCQKPLGRNLRETTKVVNTAKEMNRLLGIDFSYRYVRSLQAVYDCISQGQIGDVYAVNLVFHNAYGPDKDWFYDVKQSGGGCVIDLGIHLIDLCLWILDFPEILQCSSKLYSKAKPFNHAENKVEDYASAQLISDNGTVINLACSWNLSAGCDAIIKAEFFGKDGAAVWGNVNGSFFNFKSKKMKGTASQILFDSPDDWFGKAAAKWSEKLVKSCEYDSDVESVNAVAKVIDMIYQRY